MFPAACSTPPKNLLQKLWQIALCTNSSMRLVEGMTVIIGTSRPRIS